MSAAKRLLWLSPVILGLSLMPNSVQASTITYTQTFQISLTAGPDTLGLNGATIVQSAVFACGATYQNRFGFPEIDALSDSLSISGASVGATNGNYVEPIGLGFYPTFGGQIFRGGPTNGHEVYTVNGAQLQVLNTAAPVGGIVIGQTIATSHFGTTVDPTFNNADVSNLTDGSNYTITQFSASATVIPEPASMILWGVGAVIVGGGAGWRRRRKRLANA